MTDDELKNLFDSLQQDLRKEIQQGNAELRRHMDVALEATDHKIELVAEGVALTREELARVEARLDEKIDRTSAETQAMIKFSHADLDHRMRTLEGTQRTLEEGFADLQARVERLESSTH